MTGKDKEILELKRQVDNYKESYYKAVSDAATQLAAKEKECEDRCNNLMDEVTHWQRLSEELKAGHDAEMCAFAEWLSVEGYSYAKDELNDRWVKDFGFNDESFTTTELLKQFRDEKHPAPTDPGIV
jgi:hypothetical protein